jgi:hypothetical protein
MQPATKILIMFLGVYIQNDIWTIHKIIVASTQSMKKV